MLLPLLCCDVMRAGLQYCMKQGRAVVGMVYTRRFYRFHELLLLVVLSPKQPPGRRSLVH
jgi:hypothetical protein